MLFRSQPPEYYSLCHTGSRFHTQMRLGMCPLNKYLHKINVTNSPACVCGHPNETISHFLLECPIYAQDRAELYNGVESYVALPTSRMELLHVLLFGDQTLNTHTNAAIFKCVQIYVVHTKRFA